MSTIRKKKKSGPGYAAIKAEYLVKKKVIQETVESSNSNKSSNVNNDNIKSNLVNDDQAKKQQYDDNKKDDKRGKRNGKRKRGMNSARTKKEMGLETAHSLNLCREF